MLRSPSVSDVGEHRMHSSVGVGDGVPLVPLRVRGRCAKNAPQVPGRDPGEQGNHRSSARAKLKAHAVRRSYLALIPLAVLLAACGAKPTSAQQPAAGAGDPTSTPTSTPVTASTVPAVKSSALTYVSTMQVVNQEGDTAILTLRRAPLGRATAMRNGADKLGSSCVVDSATDAVVPFVITLTNTTKAFSDSPSLSLSLAPVPFTPAMETEGVEIEAAFASGVSCTQFPFGGGPTPPFTVSASNLAPGAEATLSGFFIAKNYFSPNFPHGDAKNYSSVDFVISIFGWSTTSKEGLLTGPGVYGQDMVALDPASGGGCVAAGNCTSVVPLGGY